MTELHVGDGRDGLHRRRNHLRQVHVEIIRPEGHRTHGGTTDGRLNHPCVWHGLTSMLAFFSLRPGEMLRAPYVSTKPIVECTFAEAIRDCWCHTYALTVDGLMVWDTTYAWRNQFEPLMYDLRGWRALEPRRRGRIKASVVRDLRIAVDRLSKMTGRG